MTSLDVETVTELLKAPMRKPRTKDGPWVCPKCNKWTTSQDGAKYHKCKA